MSRLGNLRTTQTSGKIPKVVACGERTIRPGVPSPSDNLQAALLSCPYSPSKLSKLRNSKKQPIPEGAGFSENGEGAEAQWSSAPEQWVTQKSQTCSPEADLTGQGSDPSSPLAIVLQLTAEWNRDGVPPSQRKGIQHCSTEESG